MRGVCGKCMAMCGNGALIRGVIMAGCWWLTLVWSMR